MRPAPDPAPVLPDRLPGRSIRTRPPRPSEAWPLRRSLAVLGAVAGLVSALMITAGALALASLSEARTG